MEESDGDEEKVKQAAQGKKGAEGKETVLIRFLQPVPKFVGRELETYGPFDMDDIATLPSEIADVLIRKQRAEEISGD